jgi:ABC-2 type transport system permease protein
MPVFDQGYQHWKGELAGHAWRWLAVTRQGVRAGLKGRWVRIVLLFAWVPALGLATVLILWGLIEQRSSLVEPLLNLLKLPPDIASAPRGFRMVVWTLAFHYFLQVETFFWMILVLMVGPSLISQDLRFNAIPLYFSRPLRRFDYFLGKLGVIGTFLAAVTVFPAVLAWLLGVLFSLDFGIFKDTFGLLCATIVNGLVVVVSAGTLMLALSSLSRNSRYVGLFWFGLWFLSTVTYNVLYGIQQERIIREGVRREQAMAQRQREPAAPPGQPNVRRNPGRAGGEEAWQRIYEDRRAAQRNDWTPLLSYAGNLTIIESALLDTNAAWEQIGAMMPPPRRDQMFVEFAGPQCPWYWSAGVLAGLFGLSLWILTSRVKSLDRLK